MRLRQTTSRGIEECSCIAFEVRLRCLSADRRWLRWSFPRMRCVRASHFFYCFFFCVFEELARQDDWNDYTHECFRLHVCDVVVDEHTVAVAVVGVDFYCRCANCYSTPATWSTCSSISLAFHCHRQLMPLRLRLLDLRSILHHHPGDKVCVCRRAFLLHLPLVNSIADRSLITFLDKPRRLCAPLRRGPHSPPTRY